MEWRWNDCLQTMGWKEDQVKVVNIAMCLTLLAGSFAGSVARLPEGPTVFHLW